MDSADAPDRLIVGRVARAHGLRGEVSVEILTDVEGRFAAGTRLMLNDREVVVTSSRPHQGRMLVVFEDVNDRTGAEALRGGILMVDASEAKPLPDGAYYRHQLEGLPVVDEAGAELGTMTRVEETPAADLWVVTVGRREVLVPAVREIVVAVDLEAGRIVLRPPEGLFS